MANHLGHKIAWNRLSDALQIVEESPNQYRVKVDDRGYRQIKYFSQTLLTQLTEFAKTDRTNPIESLAFNGSWWSGCYMSPTYSILGAYIELNLLLLDYHKFSKVITSKSDAFECCRGQTDGKHPYWLSEKFKQIDVTKPFDKITTELIQNYCQTYFKCLYIMHKHQNIDQSEITYITTRTIDCSFKTELYLIDDLDVEIGNIQN